MRGGLLAALLCLAASFASPAWAPAAAASDGTTSPASGALSKPSALVVFVSATPAPGESSSDATERELSSIGGLSTGIMSASQGTYTAAQLALDITQGARISSSSYRQSGPPALTLVAPQNPPASGRIEPWAAVLRRAETAPQLLKPGLLASQIPGGVAYAGMGGSDSAVAATRSGRVAAVSQGSPTTLLARISRLERTHQMVVADLPGGEAGNTALKALVSTRPRAQLLLAIQRAPDGQGHALLWVAAAGLGKGGQTLTSQTTNERGLVVSIDVAPTILDHLGVAVPPDMRGKTIKLDGNLEGVWIRKLKARLEAIGGRRLPAIAWLVAAWALMLVAVHVPLGGKIDRHARIEARRAWALRVGALALMWTPVAILLPAALEPGRTLEFAVIVATCFALAALTDAFVSWPRAPIVPAVSALLALTVDALAGTQLLVRSVLGPDPILGARFYGIGNELKSALAVLVFSAVAAALYPAVRSRRAATTMACAGILLAVVEGSARIGAGVGGVILVSAGTAVATVMLLPGTLNRKRILLVMAAPVLGLIALAALDLATAHGSGHFTGSVLDARSPGDIRDLVVRRYGAAWNELKNHLMPVATAVAVVASVLAVRYRERVCAPVGSDPAWLAALSGGLTAGAIGALSEDSGPVLLVVAVLMLGCMLGYLWGKPSRATASVRAVRAGSAQHDLVL